MRGLLPSLIVLLCMQYATAQWLKFVLSKGMTCEDRCKKRTKMCNPLDEFRDCKCFPRQLVDNGLQLPIDPYLVCRMNWAGVVPKCCDLYKQQEDSKKNFYNQSEIPSRNCNHEIDQLKTRLASCEQDGKAGTSNTTSELFTLMVEQTVKQNLKLEQLEKRLDNQRQELETSLGDQREEIGQLETSLGNQREEMENTLTLQNRKHSEASEAIEQLKDGLSSEQTEILRISNQTAKMVSSLGEQNQDIEALTQAWSTEPWKQLAESVSASGSIGFTAYLNHDAQFKSWGDNIKFNKVLTNDGNCYNPSTGVFTVPVAGTYLFIFTIYGQPSGNRIFAMLDINTNNKLGASVTNGQKMMAGSSALLRLTKGDLINIGCYTRNGRLIGSSNKENSFTGFLVHK